MLARSAIVRLSNRRVLQVKGADAHRFLQGILTNDMKAVAKPQDAIYAAFLTSKGRVLGDCNVVQVEVCHWRRSCRRLARHD
jgi:transferase CAF17, mitochondrial